MTAEQYMRVTLIIDRVNEAFERRRAIGICRMYADLWKKEWLAKRA
jgi:hypothetical protein